MLVHLQAADILTKPFTNSEKWETALRLMGMSSRPPQPKETKTKKACEGDPFASMRPEPSLAQGNLLALQLTSTVVFSLSFVVDLIPNLVTNLERHLEVAMSSDVRKREMSQYEQTEWTFVTSC